MANVLFYGYLTPYRIDIYNAFHDKMGCEIYFFWDHDRSQKHDMKHLNSLCSFTPHYTRGFTIRRRKVNFDIWSIIRKENPNLVIVPEFKLDTIMVLLYRWLFRKCFKVVALCDDSYDMVANSHEFTRMHRWAREVVGPKLDDIILVDSKVVDWYRCRYKKGIWLPLIRDEKKELPLYESSKRYKDILLDKYKLHGKRVLLFVGRLVPVKNLPNLLDAISLSKETYVTVFVGTGILETALKEKTERIDKEILFVGRSEGDELRAWYQIAHSFILSSTQEAFGAVTNEALLAGCFCLISQNCGSSCLINEKNGLLFNPGNIQEMADSIDLAMKQSVIQQERKSQMPFSFDEMFNKVKTELS